ncbi:MAG: hypothetical protein KDC05_09745 [Bacteroidales bacterium]|nr:hypothetical protein [Bacteroidales bacterium]
MRKFLSVLILSVFSMTLGAQTILDTAVNFSVKDVHGNNFELFSILDQNKIVVIDFFSTS